MLTAFPALAIFSSPSLMGQLAGYGEGDGGAVVNAKSASGDV